MLHKKMQRRVVSALCISVIFTAGCANNQTQNIKMQSLGPTAQRASILVANQSTYSNTSVYIENDGLVWVPLDEAARSMDLEMHSSGDSFNMGITDPLFSVKMNQTDAVVSDNPTKLPQAPKMFDHKPYLTTQALSSLLGTPVNWKEQYSQVVITPIDDRSLAELQNPAIPQQPGPGTTTETLNLSLAGVNKSDIINYARTFLGTPYKFASGPYTRTGTFDCSSFVQHVFNRFGVRVPRSSRSQSRVGNPVTVSNLQPGDLMFFYTPGRFASNRIVGHVGMYAGNGQIIHTYGRPGVTITDFNAYWRRRFLFAKRVV